MTGHVVSAREMRSVTLIMAQPQVGAGIASTQLTLAVEPKDQLVEGTVDFDRQARARALLQYSTWEEQRMSARCPKCGWKLPLFARRPGSRALVGCENCTTVLRFHSSNGLIRVLMFLVFLPVFFLARMDENNSGVYATVGIVSVLCLMVLSNLLEKFELEESFD